ncbi:sugar kinase [Halioxenophilus aromaticivorans]|uniref:2-dehydro-3-deoxygluconokinase n=1 Tax=Halioxenophilus aromaticivorans TaxID=1306992 RepID=A0AAV3U4N1_9ALTE
MWKIASIGECMLELSNPGAKPLARNMSLQFSYGGDTLNTAVYLARLGVAVDYVTALGEDPYSQWLLQDWQQQGIGTDLVAQLPGLNPGLYMIQTDAHGERSFSYWRKQSAATQLWADAQRAESFFSQLGHYQAVYFSGITLSLYNDEDRTRFMQQLLVLRERGVNIVFDGNYRPAGWASVAQAQDWFTQAYSAASIALPTYDDEAQLFGDTSPAQTAQRLANLGVAEVIVKHGAQGVLVQQPDNEQWVPTQPVAKMIDSTAAGDSFNAGFLAARARGLAPAKAAEYGHRLAGTVIQHPGAIIAQEHMPAFEF